MYYAGSRGAGSGSSSSSSAGLGGVAGYLGMGGVGVAGVGGYSVPPYGYVHPGMPAGNLYLQALLHANMALRPPQSYPAQPYPMNGHDPSGAYAYGQPMGVGGFPAFPYPNFPPQPSLQVPNPSNDASDPEQWAGQQRRAPESSGEQSPSQPKKKVKREEASPSPTSSSSFPPPAPAETE
jgi:hypothetical protein